jgi:CBS domain containing-hemolysin-like protein
VSAAVSFGLITTVHIVLGELAPKGLALQRTEATALAVARPMQLFHAIFRWPIATLNSIGNGVLRVVGLEPSTGHEMVHSVEELRLLVTGMQEAGVVEASEARIATRAFHFADLPAGELMTPRTEIEAVPLTSTLAELLSRAAISTHSRWLVYDGSLDNIVGVLPVRSLFRLVEASPDGFCLQTLLRPVLIAPASKPAGDLLEELRSSRQQLAVLLDEFGGTAGIVTPEDLLEALIGPASARGQEPDGSLILDGLTRLSHLEELAGVRFDADARQVDTLGGLVMHRLGRIPSPGDEIRLDGWLVRVEELEGRRAARLRLEPAPALRARVVER